MSLLALPLWALLHETVSKKRGTPSGVVPLHHKLYLPLPAWQAVEANSLDYLARTLVLSTTSCGPEELPHLSLWKGCLQDFVNFEHTAIEQDWIGDEFLLPDERQMA